MDLKTEPEFEAISQKNSVLVHQISGMVFNNTDVILISVLCDFKAVSIYSIYNIFFSQVQSFITSITSGIQFALGQMFYADRSKFCKVFKVYETVYITATFIIYTLMAVFLLPLIQIYTKGINDTNYTNVYLVFFFVIMNLLANGKLPANNLIEYSGSFKKTRSHALWEMSINITVSIAGIMLFGITGAILGTIVALVYRGIVVISYSNKKVLGRSCMNTYKIWIVNGAVFSVVMLIFFVDAFRDLSFLQLLLKGVIHSIWIVALYIGANYISNREVFKTILELYRGKKNQ